MKLTKRILLIIWLVLLTAFTAFAASPYSGNANQAVQWLSQNQNIDGSWGTSSDVKLPCTVEAIMALRALNQRTSAYYWGVTWLENHNSPNVDYRACRILGLGPRGDNVQEDLKYVKVEYQYDELDGDTI